MREFFNFESNAVQHHKRKKKKKNKQCSTLEVSAKLQERYVGDQKETTQVKIQHKHKLT